MIFLSDCKIYNIGNCIYGLRKSHSRILKVSKLSKSAEDQVF